MLELLASQSFPTISRQLDGSKGKMIWAQECESHVSSEHFFLYTSFFFFYIFLSCSTHHLAPLHLDLYILLDWMRPEGRTGEDFVYVVVFVPNSNKSFALRRHYN